MTTPRITLAGGSAVQLAGSAVALALQAAHFGLVARMVPPRQFAAYVAAFAVFGIAGALAEFGLVQTTVLALKRGKDDRAVVGASLRASAFLGASAMGVAAVVVVLALPRPVWTAAAYLIPAFVLSRVQLPFAALRQHRLQVRRLALTDVTARLVSVLSLLALLERARDYDFNGRMAVAGLTAAAGTLVLVLGKAGPVRLRTGWRPAVAVIRDAVPLGLTNAASFIHVRIDQVILSAFGIVFGLAAYGVAYRVLDAAVAMVTAVGVVGFSLIVNAADDEHRAEEARRFADLLGVVAVVLGIGAFVLAPQLVRLLGGSEYDDAAWFARLLSPVLVISVLNLGPAQVAIVQRQARSLLRVAIVCLVVNVTLNLILVPRIGVRGAVAATIVSELGGLAAVARIGAASLPSAVDVRRLVAVVVGFAAATFAALGAWRTAGPALGCVVAAAGTAVAVAPVWRGALRVIAAARSGEGRPVPSAQ